MARQPEPVHKSSAWRILAGSGIHGARRSSSNNSEIGERGTITLDVYRLWHEGAEIFRFTVKDTGIGMNKEQLGRMFQAFTQADASTTRKFGGTGLGLVISRNFCQMMGGDITVESEEGKGTQFTIVLPVVVVDPKAKAPKAD